MKKLLWALWGAILLLASCEGTLDPLQEGGALKLTLSETISRTLEPELSMDPATVKVYLSGPNGEELESNLDADETETLFSGLKYGSWSIRAEAFNEEEVLIGEGNADCIVHNGQTTSVTLILSPLEGQGCLSLVVNWDVTEVETPVLQGILLDKEGEKHFLDFTLDGGKASACLDLNMGYYSLSLALYDDDFLCIGAMEIVRIIAEEQTNGSFDFTNIKENYGTIDVTIDVSLENPLHPLIGGALDVSGVSDPLVMTASTEEGLDNVAYAWYLDGQAVAWGGSYTFLSDETGPYRIDLAAFSSDGSRAGSTGFTLLVSDEVSGYMKISEVQGAGHVSPYVNQSVEKVIGVVTACDNRGFWMQSLAADDDFSTSEGIYVYTYSAPERQPGDLVLVDGTVQEYGYSGALKLTELNYVTVETLQSGYPLPDPVHIGLEGILPPDGVICNDADETVYNSLFDPEEDSIDFFEALESMLVEIDNPVAVGGTKYGEIPVIPRGLSYESATNRGGLILSESNANPQRLHIDTDAAILGYDPLNADTGDTFAEPVQGVVGYDYGKYLILPTMLPQIQHSGLSREITDLTGDEDHLTVATFNMENFPRDDEAMTENQIEEKIADMAETFVIGMGSPDIVCVQEMTDDSCSEDDGTVSSDRNAGRLIQAVTVIGGPGYEYVDVDPVDKQDGGWTTANIRVGYFYNPDRVSFTPAGNPGALDETSLVLNGDELSLTLNPGRFSIDSFANSRKSLLAQFEFQGQSVFLINNHLCSKGGDDYQYGEYQPPRTPSEEERLVQAGAVRDMVQDILNADEDANIVLMGDLNDFPFSGTLGILGESGLVSLTEELLSDNERYSYIYEGNSQQLDHMLVSPALLSEAKVNIVHRYAEFDSESRHTDHDPIVASLYMGTGETVSETGLFFSEYAEGSSNNKYVEICNPSAESVSLEGYQLLCFNNGGTTSSGSFDLIGSLAGSSLYVVMNSGADPLILDKGDTTLTVFTY
ncbi:MAG: endonuclease/exonuclease/phosphatase family protein [Spirochaetales bacterium]|nr:endonuclease/exonuclease/phosphatase family protein [Spirochaetales bacterium]